MSRNDIIRPGLTDEEFREWAGMSREEWDRHVRESDTLVGALARLNDAWRPMEAMILAPIYRLLYWLQRRLP